MKLRPSVRVRSDDRASRALFGAIAAAFGILGAVQFIRPALATWRADGWIATPCTILASRAEEEPGGRWRLAVRYRYERDGAAFESVRWCAAAEKKSVESVRERDALLAPFPEGAAAVCRVDPADPARAVLSRDAGAVRESLAGFAFTALVFAPVGLWLLVSAARGRRPAHPSVRPDGKGAPHERLLAGLVGLLFFGAGSWLLVAHAIPEFFPDRCVRGWEEAEAVVTRADRTNSGRYLAWAHEAGGARFEDDTAGTGRRFGISGDAVPAAATGDRIRVLVDPRDPSRSILPPRPPPPAARLVLIFPLLFVVLGAVLAGAALTGNVGESARLARRRRSARRSGGRTAVREAPGNTPAPVMLAAWTAFLLIGAGVASLPGTERPSGAGIWLVVAVFLAAEAWLVVATVRHFLRRRGPHLRIDLGGAAPRPGEAVAFSWLVEGVAWNLRSLCLELVGVVPSPDQNGHRETIRYDEVLRETLFETTDSRRAARGEGSFTIPAALPDGIDPLSVDWTIVATGEVSGGPSLRDELPVPVAER